MVFHYDIYEAEHTLLQSKYCKGTADDRCAVLVDYCELIVVSAPQIVKRLSARDCIAEEVAKG
jgi:hypothetical protein